MQPDRRGQGLGRIDIGLPPAVAESQRVEGRRHGKGDAAGNQAGQRGDDHGLGDGEHRCAELRFEEPGFLCQHGRQHADRQPCQHRHGLPARAIQSLPEGKIRFSPKPADKPTAADATIKITLRWSQGAGPLSASIAQPRPLSKRTPIFSVPYCHRARDVSRVMPAKTSEESKSSKSPGTAAIRPANNQRGNA